VERVKIKKWVHPVDKFPRISHRASLMEAVAALKKADAYCQAGCFAQRILLAYDAGGRIVGKLSPVDIVGALASHCESSKANIGGWSKGLIVTLLEKLKQYLLPGRKPLAEHWQKAHRISMSPYIKRYSSSNMIGANDTMEVAFRLFVAGRHDSLFVVQKKEIHGLLLFADVYKEISRFLECCPLAQLGGRDSVRLPIERDLSPVPRGLSARAPATQTV